MEAKNIVVNGTSYPTNIPSNLVDVLEKCRLNKTRIVIDYGDTETGISFGEIHDTTGYVGRTSCESTVPIILDQKAVCVSCLIGFLTSKNQKERN